MSDEWLFVMGLGHSLALLDLMRTLVREAYA